MNLYVSFSLDDLEDFIDVVADTTVRGSRRVSPDEIEAARAALDWLRRWVRGSEPGTSLELKNERLQKRIYELEAAIEKALDDMGDADAGEMNHIASAFIMALQSKKPESYLEE